MDTESWMSCKRLHAVTHSDLHAVTHSDLHALIQTYMQSLLQTYTRPERSESALRPQNSAIWKQTTSFYGINWQPGRTHPQRIPTRWHTALYDRATVEFSVVFSSCVTMRDHGGHWLSLERTKGTKGRRRSYSFLPLLIYHSRRLSIRFPSADVVPHAVSSEQGVQDVLPLCSCCLDWTSAECFCNLFMLYWLDKKRRMFLRLCSCCLD